MLRSGPAPLLLARGRAWAPLLPLDPAAYPPHSRDCWDSEPFATLHSLKLRTCCVAARDTQAWACSAGLDSETT